MATTNKGGRPPTGYVKWRTNPKTQKPQWMVEITLKGGGRSPWVPLNPNIPQSDRPAARAAAKLVSDDARTQGLIPDEVRETVEEYAGRWHDWREERGLQCVKDDRARMKNHVLPILGTLDVRAVTRTDLEKLVERLDARIASKDLGWKVAGMAWSNVTRMFGDACSAKRLDLRVRDDNPAENILAPERGMKKEKQYLWPSEFLALVTCPKVPLRWRRLFALAVYAYARAGEIEALAWEDVTFDNMTIHIHRSVDRVRKRGKVKSTKTGVSRRIPIEPNLYPLLRTLHDEVGGKGKVIAAMPSPGMLSRKLKFYLAKAGVTRAELFAGDETRKAITFHDLRATGITWMAARGDDPLRIKQRAGHSSFSTTEGYIREAENLGRSFGSVFPTLPSLVRGFPEVSRFGELDSENSSDSGPSGWAQQDLKPPCEDAGSPTKEGDPSSSSAEPPRETIRGSKGPKGSPPVRVPPDGEPTDAELEAAIVRAMLGGHGAVAEELTRQLRARRETRAKVLRLPIPKAG